LKLKNIGPCKIVNKFSTNAYEIELPKGVGIPLIFNVENLYPYRGDGTREVDDQDEVHWMQHMPAIEKL